MTLIYRGQKYDQQKAAVVNHKSTLTYRGVSYAK